MQKNLSQLQHYYQKHQRWIPIASFALGFLFDAITLRRIDDASTIIQQAVYLVAALGLLAVELLEQSREVTPPRLLARFWQHREFLFHFLLGGLLNSYTIFYFKSASAWSSFLFIGLLVVILTMNEFLRFGKSQIQVHMALASLCLISYLESLAPILLGFSGLIPFFLAILASVLTFAWAHKRIKPWFAENPKFLRTHFLLPYAGIHLVFVGLYFGNAIPPVPLAVSYMGIYHGAEKKDGNYHLSFTRPAWKFWQNGDETFLARPGDELICYAQIFSPTRFKEQLQVRWLLWNKKRGWQSQDAIPLVVTGGREEGYRIITRKNNYQPGEWRVQIETLQEQEVGRLNFTVTADDSTEERTFHIAVR